MRRRILTAVLLPLCLAGCSSAAGAARASSGPEPDDTISFVVVGDSITAGTQPIEGTEVPGVGSWLPGAEGDPLEFEGGWAVPGATTAEMREGVVPSEADVVVVLAGTNDLILGIPYETTRDNLLAIVDTTGVDDVLLATVPPVDTLPAQREDYNRRLRALADEQGWQLVDPWTAVERQGSWAPGTSTDGVHPTQDTADGAGRSIRAALLEAARG